MTNQLRTAVVGVDFSSAGDRALSSGLALLAHGCVDELHLLHVLDPHDVMSDDRQPLMETEEQVLERAPGLLLARAGEIAERDGVVVPAQGLRVHVRIGRPVEELLQVCADYEAQLLVVGTHGRRGFEGMLLGSVAETIARKARCQVLIARPIDYQGVLKTQRPDPPYAPGEEPQRGRERPSEPVGSTTLDGWHPSDNGPTGFRIV